jgi:glycosyltransferase involved in cell wall biosynthesis
MAAGCLPIVSELPVYRDWITDGSNGLIITNENSLTTLLRHSISQPALRERAAKINRQLVRERAINEELFPEVLNYYKKVVGEA